MNSTPLSPTLIAGIISIYFLILIVISRITSKDADNDSFFKANRSAPWLLVAIGMIGASLSGVTFISIPGLVGTEGANQQFAYMQMVFGYLVGYLIIGSVLLPLYYKHNLTSIYGYLGKRMGINSYKTGSGFFLLSRLIGSSFRLYLIAIVFDKFISGPMGIPFFVTVLITIVLIWVYTNKGGIKTIIVTDVFQTISMLLALVLTIIVISKSLGLGMSGIVEMIDDQGYGKMFFFEDGWSDANNFFKQFFSGSLMALVMTGLDQDMMQKNLTCRTLKDSQKNMFLFSIILVVANFLFLVMGALMYLYVAENPQILIPERSDYLYPTLALQYLPSIVGVAFILGLTASSYSSADSALTALTTAFCVDFLNMEESNDSEENKKATRRKVHIGFSIVIFCIIIVFNLVNNEAVINGVFTAATYTYGPLLGLFSFGLMTKINVKDKYVWIVCILTPILGYIIDINSAKLFNGFQFGFMILLLNGILTFVGLLALRKTSK